MKAKDRQEKIEAVLASRKPVHKKSFVYEGKTRVEDCFEIPIKYLVFNKYNSRIASYTKTHERLIGSIDSSSEEGEETIMKYLWETNSGRNKKTKDDIQKHGQLVPGIITKDGVIIDGNRRCMILKRIAREEQNSSAFFVCAVLPDTLDGNPQEIRKLETAIQLASDPVLEYNPIEKYLTCRQLKQDGLSEKEIANLMNEKGEKQIKEYLGILSLMDRYLGYIQADGMYQLLTEEKLEGPFFDLYNYLRNPKRPDSDWEPGKLDLAKLEVIIFDCIRAGYRKEMRLIIRKGGVFDRKKLWDAFVKEHGKVETATKAEESIKAYIKKNKEGKSFIELVRDRDLDWRTEVGPQNDNTPGAIDGMMDNAERRYKTQRDQDKPYQLLQQAHEALATLMRGKSPLQKKDEVSLCQQIKQLASELLKRKPSK